MPEDINICEGYEAAPFCEGESVRECPGGIEVAENAACPGNAELADGALGSPDPVDVASCEEDGSCDDSCTAPARGDCTLGETTAEVVVPEPGQIAELPATGPDQIVSLALMAAMALTAGIGIIRR